MAGVELWEHQLKALEKMKNGCILNGGVGTGKSITAAAYFYNKVCDGDLRINSFGGLGGMSNPKDVYVITTARKRNSLDWEKEFAGFGISTNRETSVYGIQLTVDSFNNIEKYQDVKDAFFIFDEQRLVGAGAWVKAFIKIAKANEWIMLSATPGDNWMDYAPVFIANGFFKNRTEFVREHVVFKRFVKFPAIDRYTDEGKLERLRRSILIDMPMRRHTTRHIQNVMVENNKELFEKVWKGRWNIYEDRPIRDIAELFRVMRKLVNTHPSRISALARLHTKHPKLIVFYNFDYELHLLREHAEKNGILYHEWNGHKHQDVPVDERWLYFVQYTAGAEAWNCTTTDAMVLFSLNYSYKVNDQVLGRIDRANTPFIDLYYYKFRSNSVIDNAILRSLATKKSFNEKEFLNDQRSYTRAA
ncbi:helicase [Arthrobacter phage CastorTray]|uniref:Helicase n=1 Tax=Arthrobacter phage CastorTray TaxID=2859632 RepID=A0AAE8BDI7_9CAUD|nr:helicase [Arthrobacter phage CastorTray]QYC55058.1 helicase [Arthrobacter phage CastorTray]